jgi:hypothetical protein
LTLIQVSPDGKSAYLAYLDTTYNAVYVQQVDTTTFAAVGDAVQVEGAREGIYIESLSLIYAL